jgi:hypothetical protein
MGVTYSCFLKGLLLAAVVTAFAAAPSVGLAQEAEGEQDDARTFYKAGKEAYEAGKYAEAEEAFQKAYDAKPHPTVLKSIAECKVQLGDLTGAIELFEKFLADPAASKKEEVQARVTELKGMMASLEVTSAPEGAAIALDGTDTGKTTPSTFELAPGDHEVVLTAEGYEPLMKQVTLAKGQDGQVKADFAAEGIKVPTEEPALADPFASEEGGGEEEVTEDDSEGPPAAFWVCAAVAGVGLVSGTVFGTMALGDEKDYKDNPTKGTKESGERNAIIADVSFGVAAAAAVVGAVILITDAKGGEAEVEADADTAKRRWDIVPVAGGDTIGVATAVTF